MYRKIIILLLCSVLLLQLLPLPAVASYENGYDGTMAGDGTGIYAYGVDLSEWQGHEVDFYKIKDQGYSFVILRAGFASTIDDCFEENYAKAKEAGLDVGVYLYSYADNTDEAKQEAEAMLGWLSGKQLEYPVYYDLEDPKCHGSMSVELLTEIAFTFLDMLAAEGWLVGIYSCKSWLENKFDTAAIGETYECWMAQFVSSGTYEIYDRYDEVYGMWQYSCTGSVDGVPGGVDMNVCFKDYPGICRQYGFNGYPASDSSLLLSNAVAPSLLIKGDAMEISGKVISTKGNLTNVTAGIYSLDGQVLTGRSAGPQSASIDLADFSSGIKAHELAEGTYLFRISASNSYESCILLNQTLIVSKSGVSILDLSLPKDLKQGYTFSLSGSVLCAREMKELTLTVTDQSGEGILQFHAEPKADVFDLNSLQADLSVLPMGEYRMMLEILTANALYCPVDVWFDVWAANDPIRLEQFHLQSEYFPGEFSGLTGEIISSSSILRQIDVEIQDSSGAVVKHVISQPGKTRVSLSNYEQRLGIDELPIGVYRFRISALNDGGPKVLLDQRFLIREDTLGLCGLEVPDCIFLNDSYSISGAVFSDATMLTYVGITVTDREGRAVLSAGALPNRDLFDLSSLNDKLQFSSLPCGEYQLQIMAENESGGALLFDAKFYVVDHTDGISWEELCMDPRGIAYSSASGYYLNGVLRSAESPLAVVRAEILLADGTVFASAELRGGGQTLSLEKCNEMLRFSALPEGTYFLRVEAENSSGSYEMLYAPFIVSQCTHSSIRSGKVIQPGCVSCGAVTDSRCMDCGGKVRSGFLMDATGHSEENGSCIRCGKTGFVTVSVEISQDMPTAHGRYVIANKDGESWYALSSDGTTVRIPAPDAQGQTSISAGLLWSFEQKGEEYLIRSPLGKLLHLDSNAVVTARGRENGVFILLDQEGGLILCLAEDEGRTLSFEEGQFIPSSEGAVLVLMRYIP